MSATENGSVRLSAYTRRRQKTVRYCTVGSVRFEEYQWDRAKWIARKGRKYAIGEAISLPLELWGCRASCFRFRAETRLKKIKTCSSFTAVQHNPGSSSSSSTSTSSSIRAGSVKVLPELLTGYAQLNSTCLDVILSQCWSCTMHQPTNGKYAFFNCFLSERYDRYNDPKTYKSDHNLKNKIAKGFLLACTCGSTTLQKFRSKVAKLSGASKQCHLFSSLHVQCDHYIGTCHYLVPV